MRTCIGPKVIQPARDASGVISWVVVNTHPHKERFATENLNQLQFVGYCPMLLKRIRHARRTDVVSRPMFPAHVFAGVHVHTQRWRTILSTPGVYSIVRGGNALSVVPTRFVDVLQACEVNGNVVAPGTHRDDGQHAIGCSADYSALISTMVEMRERERMLALFTLLRPGADPSGIGTPLARPPNR